MREVEHKRAECWKYWKGHQNRIRAVDEQEEEVIEQVERQTCWMVDKVDEVALPPEASWSRPKKLASRSNLSRWPKSGRHDSWPWMHGCVWQPFQGFGRGVDCDIDEVEESVKKWLM